MRDYSRLNHIANGLQAASKIREIQSTRNKRGSSPGIIPSDVSTLHEMLRVVHEYSPDTHREALGRALDKSSIYIDTYKAMKQHLKTSRSQRLNKDNFIQVLSIMMPVMDSRNQHLVQKLLKLYELFS